MSRRGSPGSAAALIAAALIAAVAAGCGSGDGDDRLDAAELVSRGDALCRSGQQRFDAIQKAEPATPREAARQTEELVGVAAAELDELRALRPPNEVSSAYDSYLAARAAALELLEKGRDAAADRNAERDSKAQAELAAGAAERRRLARAVGFEVCSQERGGG
jgi:hypothetical protein